MREYHVDTTAFLLRTAAIVLMTIFSSKQTVDDDISLSAFVREETSGQMSKVHFQGTPTPDRRSQACL